MARADRPRRHLEIPGAPKTALEAHTLGLAAELTATGVTVNIMRSGPVDTAMPAWILDQPPTQVGAELHEPVRGDARCGSDGFARPTSGVIADLIIGDTTGQIAGADNPATISG